MKTNTATPPARKPLVTVNREQGLYVIPAPGGGFSCLGFDVCARRAAALASEMGLPAPVAKRGTLAAFREFRKLQDAAHQRNAATGWKSKTELTPELIPYEGKRVEVRHQWEGSPVETVRFYVGRSTGWIPCHIAIARRDSVGGPAVCLGKILSVRTVATR